MSARSASRVRLAVRLTGATALATVATLAVSPAMGLAAPPSGTLAVLPAKGTDLTTLLIVTAAACPAGTNIQATLSGPGFPAAGQNIVGNSPITAYERTRTGGLRIPISLTLRDIANLPVQVVHYAGRYQVTVNCRDRVRLPVLASFTGTLVFSSPQAYAADNPVVVTELAPMDASAGVDPMSGAAPGVSPLPSGSAASGPAPAAAPVEVTPVATSAPAHSWPRWAGLVVLCLGGVGLLISAVTAVRRSAKPARP